MALMSYNKIRIDPRASTEARNKVKALLDLAVKLREARRAKYARPKQPSTESE